MGFLWAFASMSRDQSPLTRQPRKARQDREHYVGLRRAEQGGDG